MYACKGTNHTVLVTLGHFVLNFLLLTEDFLLHTVLGDFETVP